MKTNVNITVDLDELFVKLEPVDKVKFIKDHLYVLDAVDMEPYVNSMGFKIVGEDE